MVKWIIKVIYKYGILHKKIKFLNLLNFHKCSFHNWNKVILTYEINNNLYALITKLNSLFHPKILYLKAKTMAVIFQVYRILINKPQEILKRNHTMQHFKTLSCPQFHKTKCLLFFPQVIIFFNNNKIHNNISKVIVG